MTLAAVRRKTDRIREFSALPFLLIAAVAVAGVLVRPAPQAVTGGPITPATWRGCSRPRPWSC